MMDHRFLEFLGQYFMNAAAYQKQSGDILRWMNKWIGQDGSGSDEITHLFKKSYGIDGNVSSEKFFNAFKAFKTSYWELFSIPGMVSEKKYKELDEKYRRLKERCEAQEETISMLSSMSRMHDTFQNNINEGIEHVMENQRNIFEKLLAGLTS